MRNGTQNLFAALEVHAGEVTGMTSKTRHRFAFLRFLDPPEAEVPAATRVIPSLDNPPPHNPTDLPEPLTARDARRRIGLLPVEHLKHV